MTSVSKPTHMVSLLRMRVSVALKWRDWLVIALRMYYTLILFNCFSRFFHVTLKLIAFYRTSVSRHTSSLGISVGNARKGQHFEFCYFLWLKIAWHPNTQSVIFHRIHYCLTGKCSKTEWLCGWFVFIKLQRRCNHIEIHIEIWSDCKGGFDKMFKEIHYNHEEQWYGAYLVPE